MTKIELHPHSPTTGIVSCNLSREGSRIRAEFTFSIPDLVLPASVSAPSRRNELWRATCFELFISPRGEEAYAELNAAPSGDWNAYVFDRYREGMREALLEAPAIRTEPGRLLLEADLGDVPFLVGKEWELGISAVLARHHPDRIEYWAAEHKTPRPDFHFRGAFLVRL